jgi:hypothetical protein
MRIDRYTKVILTIIAACLVWLSVGGTRLLPSVQAQVPQRAATRPFPTVIKGSEFGYRVDGFREGEAPVGTLVVQIDGGWYEARLHDQK